MKINCFTFLLMLFLSASVLCQVKFEREYRLKSTEVPEKAFHIIEMWKFKKKVKWYAEESQDGKTYEAKVCYKRKKHSIEFKENGDLIDVEKTVKFSELKEEIQRNIEKTLSEKFKKFRIKKVQIQYKGAESAIYAKLFQLKSIHEEIIPKYEIILKGKNEKRFKNFEILFNKDGVIEKKILIKSTDSTNLEF